MTTPDIGSQREFWNAWNTEHRGSEKLDRASSRRRDEVLNALKALELPNPTILEVGCATGWLSSLLACHGRVTATDLADESIRKASERYRGIRFVAGDFLTLDFEQKFEVIVCVDSIASMADHDLVFSRFAQLLKPDGHLILTTQNPRVMGRYTKLEPLAPGQIRNWASRSGLKQLTRNRFKIRALTTALPTVGDVGLMKIVHAYKLNRIFAALFGEARLQPFKERLGFGQTIVLVARKC